MKILDIVRHTSGSVGMITEGGSSFSIRWFGSPNIKSAWWSPEEGLEVIDNLPNFLAKNMAHPFGNNKQIPDKVYPYGKEE